MRSPAMEQSAETPLATCQTPSVVFPISVFRSVLRGCILIVSLYRSEECNKCGYAKFMRTHDHAECTNDPHTWQVYEDVEDEVTGRKLTSRIDKTGTRKEFIEFIQRFFEGSPNTNTSNKRKKSFLYHEFKNRHEYLESSSFKKNPCRG